MAVLNIPALLDGHDGFNKSVLEDVVGHIFIFYCMVYIHEKTVLVSLQQRIKGLVLAIDIQRNELLIALVLIYFHYFLLLVNNR